MSIASNPEQPQPQKDNHLLSLPEQLQPHTEISPYNGVCSFVGVYLEDTTIDLRTTHPYRDPSKLYFEFSFENLSWERRRLNPIDSQ
ncbi:hypothetical protein F2Q68_00027204 [Brassica cretica]|uniref:Uncharacterized protein n=1 Tax=Brassica cretica TaxID=69181 RepID=A0A8S9IB03_BRACR|nr:hypothetical protein F2Q68_00027204 [Brassica cretica]